MKEFKGTKGYYEIIEHNWSDTSIVCDGKTPNNWVDNHIYTIDYFLYYMAKVKGYKLQKIRKHKTK